MENTDVLTEQELDALRETISEDGIDGDSPVSHRQCELVDFASRQHMLLAQMPALEALNERQAGALGQILAEAYKLPATVESGKVSMQPAPDVFRNLVEPAGISLFGLAPLNGVCCLVLPGEFLSFLVHTYFGGGSSAAGGRPDGKELTPTERRINDTFCERFLGSVEAVWKDKIALSPTVHRVEQSGEHLQMGAEDDLILRFSFVVKVMDSEFTLDWLMPYAMLEPLRPRLGVVQPDLLPSASADWERHFRNALQNVPLEVTGAFFTRTVSIADVLTFREGGIVPIQMPEEVTVMIEGVPFSMGEHGVINGKKSIKIKDLFESGARAV